MRPQEEASFFLELDNVQINSRYIADGRHEISILYDDEIIDVFAIKGEIIERVNLDLHNGIFQSVESHLREEGLL
jgi:hypothetical protein